MTPQKILTALSIAEAAKNQQVFPGSSTALLVAAALDGSLLP